MAEPSGLARCQQTVFAEDDCCRELRCEAPAAWVHAGAAAALCEVHEANARKWSGGLGSWRISGRAVPYPDGWERRPSTPGDAAAGAAPALDLAGEVRASGLVVERGPAPRA